MNATPERNATDGGLKRDQVDSFRAPQIRLLASYIVDLDFLCALLVLGSRGQKTLTRQIILHPTC